MEQYILKIRISNVEYPGLSSAVARGNVVGFILRLKAQVFSSSLYNIFRRSILNRYFGPLIFNEERIPPFTVGEDVTQEHS